MNPPPTPNPPNGNTTPARGARAIRGPQSALTDFLASHNINANQIRQDANARRAAALASRQDADEGEASTSAAAEPNRIPARRKETKAQEAKRKKEEEKAIAKIKETKRKQIEKRKRQYGSDDESGDSDAIARKMFDEDLAPLPGQMENCEICEKRFSVTGYSRAGPDGGLLCVKCSNELNKKEGAAKKKQKTKQGQARRQVQSNLLDGIYPGAKSLITLCIETLAKNVDMADTFGDLPAPLIDKLSNILCKKRMIDSTILDLFIRPGADSITITDGAKLSPDDYIRIFQVMSTVKFLRLRNAVQFKNKVVDHLLGTTVELETFSIHGANLIDDERWNRFLTEKGSHLKAFQVYYTDGHFGDEQLELLPQTCPQLQKLKVVHNQKVTDAGISHIAKLSNVKYLALELTKATQKTTSPPYVEVIKAIGKDLRSLSLKYIEVLDDSVLEAIHDHCKNLDKLRLADNQTFTDEGFAKLFTDWRNVPLTYVDLHKCRHIDAAQPRDNPDNIGFGSLGFEAMMTHSGKTLQHINVHSCRHISREAFENVFSETNTYPELLDMNLSFCQQVNDFVVGCIFRSCPNLKTLKVFGNFGVRDVKVPKGKILIGVPNALGMQIEGTEDGEGRTI